MVPETPEQTEWEWQHVQEGMGPQYQQTQEEWVGLELLGEQILGGKKNRLLELCLWEAQCFGKKQDG